MPRFVGHGGGPVKQIGEGQSREDFLEELTNKVRPKNEPEFRKKERLRRE